MGRIFERNVFLKIASIVIATALWFFVNSKGVSEITIAVPLEIKNLPEGYEIVTRKTNEVNLGLRGHERLIKSIKVQDIRVYLDLSKMKKGWGTYYINRDNIKVPPSLTVTKIDPSVVKIKIEKTEEKSVSVSAVIEGVPKKGYRVVSVTTDPAYLSIEGPKSIVTRMRYVKTEPVDVSGRSKTFRQTLNIVTNGENIRVAKNEVTVIVSISGEDK
ncbi:YbbR-like protein [bacterium BMS3Abin07]|nr:YbbR-like protein [bacterium BMS3Abin07]GBE32349.1 YbbR-like protein [bacterium BMS3Bbin05]HDO21710.1 YbbR-like domain-containing protein [Nitrospirota bacterium]HDZ87653.1 YbbR-like domain-containing protein [Nitrospirota bacterium]